MNESTSANSHKLAGYVPIGDFGFALPIYSNVETSNAMYTAVSEIEGDHSSVIEDFEIFEECEPIWISAEVSVGIGSPWVDVFVCGRTHYVGQASSILGALGDLRAEIATRSPVTFLDLALAADDPQTPALAKAAADFLGNRFPAFGQAMFLDLVVRPGVLLRILRVYRSENREDPLPAQLRDFIVSADSEGRLDIRFSEDVAYILKEDLRHKIEGELGKFGVKIGCRINVVGLRPGGNQEILVSNSSQYRKGKKFDRKSIARPRYFGLANEIAIDLGTSNTRIFARDKGLILQEDTAVALRQEAGRKRVLAVGSDAGLMLNRTADNVSVVRPLRDGVITDVEMAAEMIKHYVQKVYGRRRLIMPLDVLICVPSSATGIERAAIQTAARKAGASKVHILSQAMAAAIGAELPVLEDCASMIVYVGGGRTEVAIISNRSVILSNSITTGGDAMTDYVISYVRRYHNLLIGEVTAEKIKREFAHAFVPEDGCGKRFVVRGRDLIHHVPKEIELNQSLMAEAISSVIGSIVDAARWVLERVPVELIDQLREQGVVLAGGGALTSGLDILLENELGLPVYVADDPLSCVALGIGRAMEDPEFRTILS